jgi:YegS/Rv2252/BmrU family lipid kinase
MATKSFSLIVNPWGGKGRGLPAVDQIKPLFASAGATLDIHVTHGPGHAAALAQSLVLTDRDGLCVVGGDGTLHEAINGFMRRDDARATPLGIIPGGTGNSVCWHLGYRDAASAVERILAGNALPVDLARVRLADETVYCVNIVGWGAAVDINETAERNRWLGSPRYTLSPLWHILRPRRRQARLFLDGVAIDDEFLFVVGCNTRYTGRGMNLAPRADMGDGLIDVVAIRRASRRDLLRVFGRIFAGTHVDLPCVEYHQVKSFGIESDPADRLDLDGELKGRAPFAVEIVPGALSVFG